jgi:hypothetical protein
MPESKKEIKIEKGDLKKDMPIVKDALGDRAGDGSAMPMMASGSFMSQHSQSRMMSSGKPVAMNLMEKGKPVSSLQGAPSYMASPGDEPLMKGKGHYGKMK